MSTWKLAWIGAGAALLLTAGCSGKSIVDTPDTTTGSGGSGGSTSTTTTSSSTTTPTTTAVCDDHADCPNGVCIFSSGFCSTACELFEPCPVGAVCNDCATSSCPMCADCMAACLPADPGQCDDHDDCDLEEVCLYGLQECAPTCTGPEDCTAPGTDCNPCATGSCPGCEDCVAACTPAPN